MISTQLDEALDLTTTSSSFHSTTLPWCQVQAPEDWNHYFLNFRYTLLCSRDAFIIGQWKVNNTQVNFRKNSVGLKPVLTDLPIYVSWSQGELWFEQGFFRVRDHCSSESVLNLTKLNGNNIKSKVASLAPIHRKMPRQGELCPPTI